MNSNGLKAIPEDWKGPRGPYRQAPAEFGGEWWLVNPFTGSAPWANRRPTALPLPDGFVELFGERPVFEDFKGTSNPSQAHRNALASWEQELKYFRQAGSPPWAEPDDILPSAVVYRNWQMGQPKFYLGRYDWMARFVDSEISDYDSPAWTVINFPHLVVAQFQIRLLDMGKTPEQLHPFVPPHLLPTDEEASEKITPHPKPSKTGRKAASRSRSRGNTPSRKKSVSKSARKN